MTDKETEYWDIWNTRHRSEVLDANSVAGQHGAAVMAEVASLNLEAPRVVEVACGTGWLAGQIKGCSSYLGMDLSPGAVEIARKRVPTASFVAADFLTWDPQGLRFDLVLFVDSISSFRDQDAAMSKVFELLIAGGYLVLTSVNPFVYSRLSSVGPPAAGQVRKWLSRQQLKALLERVGFHVSKFYTIVPEGNRGILRLLNSPKLNRVARLVVSEAHIRIAKELCGLGGHFLVVAQRAT